MSVQETIANAMANLTGSTAAVFAVLVAVAVLALGAEQILHVTDLGIPWRQLMLGRTLNALALSGRCFYAVVGNCIVAALAQHKQKLEPRLRLA